MEMEMEAWAVAMIPYTVFLYYVFFTRRSEPYKIGDDLKQLIEIFFVTFNWRTTFLSTRDNEATWKLIGVYIFTLQYIPVYNKFWNYPNFGLRDCALSVSVQAAMFLTRSYTNAHTGCLVLGITLLYLKNRVFYPPDEQPADSDDSMKGE